MTAQGIVRLAMVGCGDIAGSYLDAALKTRRARIVQLFDVNQELAHKRGAEAGLPAAASFEEVLANPEVDAVILAVPHFLHAPMSLQAMAAGKHVMCDKPIATTVADGKAMIAAAKKTRRKLNINYPTPLSARARFARQLVRDGLLGEIIAINIVNAGAKPEVYWTQGWSHVTKTDWRMSKAKAGGGVTLMNVSHWLDLLFGVTGLSAVACCGRAGTFNSPPGVEVEDLAAGVLTLANGALMNVLAASCYHGGLAQAMSILGKKGQIEMAGGKPEAVRVFLSDPGNRDIKANEWTELPVPDPGDSGNGYPLMLERFASAVLDNGPVPVDPRDALHTLACVLAIYGEFKGRFPKGYADDSLAGRA